MPAGGRSDRPLLDDCATIDEATVERALARYTDDIDDEPTLEYHNAGHVRDVLGAAETLADRWEDAGEAVDRDLLAAAALYHDADYHRPVERYDHREARSAAIAARELADLGFDDPFRDRVSAAILATHVDADPTEASSEGRLLRTADLRGLAADYEVFVDATERLRREAGQLHGEVPSRVTWLNRTLRRVSAHLCHDVRLHPRTGDERASEFHTSAVQNLMRLSNEYVRE